MFRLRNIALFGSRVPAVRLLCEDLRKASSGLSFLYPSSHYTSSISSHHLGVLKSGTSDAATEYFGTATRRGVLGGSNRRVMLSTAEERRLISLSTSPSSSFSFTGSQRSSRIRRAGNLKIDSFHNIAGAAATGQSSSSSSSNDRIGLTVESTEAWLSSIPQKRSRKTREKTLEGHSTSTSTADLSLFPLQSDLLSEDQNKITMKLMADLRDSWSSYAESEEDRLPDGFSFKTFQGEVGDRLGNIRSVREDVENHLKKSILTIPDACDSWYAGSTRLLKIANEFPSSVTCEDLMRMSYDKEYLTAFNPFLSAQSQTVIQKDIILWMKLCVLEDKLARIIPLCEPDQEAMLIQELMCERTWDAEAHPRWLVFEVEGGLQIRPKQHAVAMKVLQNPGAIVQLNMGEGKTRVILPMLVLEWLSKPPQQRDIVRLHFLSQLLNEGYAHLHEVLTASVLDVKLFLLPFNRDVELTMDRVAALHKLHSFCREQSAILVQAPEHRLSLTLKRFDIASSPAVVDANIAAAVGEEMTLEAAMAAKEALLNSMRQLETEYSFHDMFDESDEILRHMYNLIYSVGTPSALPGRESRFHVCETLLAIVAYDEKVLTILRTPGVAKFGDGGDDDHSSNPSAFPQIRLIPGKELDACMKELMLAIFHALTESPPYELRWLADVSKDDSELLAEFITNRESTGYQAITGLLDAENTRVEDVLTLRGYLAGGLLFHCLQQRHRVNYGIKKEDQSKRLAVPFRACDTPSERSQFAQPEASICYTVLSYYYGGLSKEQLVNALRSLLNLNKNAQNKIYGGWFALLDDAQVTAEERSKLDSVLKIDLSNSALVELLYQKYRYNMRAINFWLNTCVFPHETTHYPHKLTATPWDLVDNAKGQCVGFSGTDDNRLLLPLHVAQSNVDELVATNGMMLDRIMENPRYFDLDDANSDQSIASLALATAMEHGCTAIIDAGALFVGRSNSQIATDILDKYPQIKSVLYFDFDDRDRSKSEWKIRDRLGRVWLRRTAPIAESDCFVFFDESRCRGADVKMAQTARALLTVGPKMRKDTLMQGAGRMRKLDKGQSLIFAGSSDITNKIREFTSIGEGSVVTSKELLEWVMLNTIDATKEGLSKWLDQGVLHCATRNSPDEYSKLPEAVELEHLYSRPIVLQSMPSLFETSYRTLKSHREHSPLPDRMQQLLGEIETHVTEYGSDFEVVRSSIDEECERELEKEVEREKEEERMLPKMHPRAEIDWDYEGVMTCDGSYYALNSLTNRGIVRLKDVWSDKKIFSGKHNLGLLGASSSSTNDEDNDSGGSGDDNIFCTHNFLQTIYISALSSDGDNDDNDNGDDVIEEFLRPVDAMLYFAQTKTFLLLSEREADYIRAFFTGTAASSPSVQFVNLAYLRLGHEKPQSPVHLSSRLSDLDIAALTRMQLLNGDTDFPTLLQQKSLIELFTSVDRQDVKAAQSAALNLPGIRGRQEMVARSDLEVICTKSQQ